MFQGALCRVEASMRASRVSMPFIVFQGFSGCFGNVEKKTTWVSFQVPGSRRTQKAMKNSEDYSEWVARRFKTFQWFSRFEEGSWCFRRVNEAYGALKGVSEKFQAISQTREVSGIFRRFQGISSGFSRVKGKSTRYHGGFLKCVMMFGQFSGHFKKFQQSGSKGRELIYEDLRRVF